MGMYGVSKSRTYLPDSTVQTTNSLVKVSKKQQFPATYELEQFLLIDIRAIGLLHCIDGCMLLEIYKQLICFSAGSAPCLSVYVKDPTFKRFGALPKDNPYS
ncbi:hypothetical protein QG37_03996 [Candidozyma auris]|nr:hypothetical protein QG37_03996 [[Candida] auris]